MMNIFDIINPNIFVVNAHSIKDDIELKAKAKEIKKAASKGKRVIVRMGRRGDTPADRLRTVKAVKAAIEESKSKETRNALMHGVRVDFKNNRYAGEFYKDAILDATIRSKDIKVEK